MNALLWLTLFLPAGWTGGAQDSSSAAGAARPAAEAALEAGRLPEANRHARRALEDHPTDPELLDLVLATVGDDEDARILYTHAWIDALADGRGRVQSKPARGRLASLDLPGRIAEQRAEALGELLAFAAEARSNVRRHPENLLLERWALRLAGELAEASPALAATLDGKRSVELLKPGGLPDRVVAALERLLGDSLSAGEPGRALRAGRILSGLVRQAAFKDLEGARPRGMDRVGKRIAKNLARAREGVAREAGRPWSVEELEWLTREEGEAFTRLHDSFAHPGVALSPGGLYRVETDCGFETLLGAASTVELHHRRLARWYGRDPFEGRPGTLRIVPTSSGLEAEGAPFWWVGGFQGGDQTVLRFAQGTIEGLGHGMTHELTHRFDGALYPGQPAWLSEGKAVWTAAAYGGSSDETFVANHALFGTIEGVWIRGFGNLAKLRTLLDGSLEDYRDNYSAGYALYVYLSTWEEEGRRPFASALQRFMEEGGRTKLAPLPFFESLFCDGKEGRPADLEAFAQGWEAFLHGFYWKTRAEWTARYTQATPPAPPSPLVYDEPTWTWQRTRSEPHFGEAQAALAARLFEEVGEEREAAAAWLWSLAVDGEPTEAWRGLARVLAAGGRGSREGAWAARQALAFPGPSLGEPAPFLSRLPHVVALEEALTAAGRSYGEEGRSIASAALLADGARLARWLGRPEPESSRPEPGDPGEMRSSFDPSARLLGLSGWSEERLVGYDRRRTPGLWYEPGGGDLVVGRRRPREASGKYDRGGGGVSFVAGDAYLLPGTYRLRTRIQATTGYVSGAVVVGYRRRDLAFRLGFALGDPLYAAGEKEEEPAFDSMSWSLGGLWERDGGLSGSNPSGGVNFDRSRTSFELELWIDGGRLDARIDGHLVGSYHTADGRPIEGRIGFATAAGAIRVQRPRIQRMERSALAGLMEPSVLDLTRGLAPRFDHLENHRLVGLPPASTGKLVLWIGLPWEGKEGREALLEDLRRRTRVAVEDLARAASAEDLTQPVVIALPAAVGEEHLALLREEARAAFGEGEAVSLVTHPFGRLSAPPEEEPPDLHKRWLLLVDSESIVRIAVPYAPLGGAIEGRLRHWLTVLREHGHPPRDLPLPEREGESEGR